MDKRFWSKVDKTGDCWLWTGARVRDGYGRVGRGGRTHSAHRYSFFLAHRFWPAYLMHTCDTPNCVNPDHLREGTHQENMADMLSKGRKPSKYRWAADRVRDLWACGCRKEHIAKWLDIPSATVHAILSDRIFRVSHDVR